MWRCSPTLQSKIEHPAKVCEGRTFFDAAVSTRQVRFGRRELSSHAIVVTFKRPQRSASTLIDTRCKITSNRMKRIEFNQNNPIKSNRIESPPVVTVWLQQSDAHQVSCLSHCCPSSRLPPGLRRRYSHLTCTNDKEIGQ